MAESPSFCVIGAGIIGLSTAYCLAKRFHGCRLMIVYDKCSPNTTSNHGFGICSIRGLDELDNVETIRWTKLTTGYLKDLIRKSPAVAKRMGVEAVSAYLVFDKKQRVESTCGVQWDTFSFHRQLDEDAINSLQMCTDGLSHVFGRSGISKHDLEVYNAGTWVIDTNSYLPWLTEELGSMEQRGDISGLKFVNRRIYDFSEVIDEDFDFIVNCSGLGAQYLVPDDKVIPIRGQYVVVNTSEQHDLRYGNHTFVCPKSGRLALGSVYQRGRCDTALDPVDRKDIMRRCRALYPNVRHYAIATEGVGIRPGRYGGARVELEVRRLGSSASPKPVIHNYGHGPRGIMQHWGCAQDVVKLAENYFKQKSKL